MPLPAVGTMSYGDVTFPSNSQTTAYALSFVRDESNRTIIYATHLITIKWVVNLAAADGATSTDALLDAIRSTLGKPGLELAYHGAGAGTLNVNVAQGGQIDVRGGPFPRGLNIRHLSPRAAEIEWTVETCLPTCDDAVYKGQAMQFVYRMEYEIDRSGYTTRRMTGFLEIPFNRDPLQSRRFSQSADDYREQIVPAELPGFRRTFGPFVVSADRSRLDFAIIDEQQGSNALPDGVVDAEISHTLETETEADFTNWRGTFAGYIEMAEDRAAQDAIWAIRQVVRQRMQETRRNLEPLEHGGGSPTNKGFILDLGFSMGVPNIFGKKVTQFSYRYKLFQPFTNILNASALWLPTDTDWRYWSVTLADSALNPRGVAGLKYEPREEAIIDLCLSQRRLRTPRESPREPPPRDGIEFSADFEVPLPEDSWILYECRMHVEEDSRVVVHQPLPKQGLSNIRVLRTLNATRWTPPAPIKYLDAIIQKRNVPGLFVYLIGRAVRAFYDIPCPQLVKIGSVEAVQANRPEAGEGFQTWALGKFGCGFTAPVVVNAATWCLRFALPRIPDVSLGALSTPFLKATAEIDRDGNLTTPNSIRTP